MARTDKKFAFVELNRTFHEISREALKDEHTEITQALHVGKSLGWNDLKKEYRLVLLSEAGSGKTEEIRNVARRLRAEGKAAFFLRLENIPDDFEDAFEVGSMDAFEKWLASSGEGWLLLDSVDEARLRDPRDFERAIKKLGRRIVAALDRTHVIITGRTSAWRPVTDLALCVRHFPITLAMTVAAEAPVGDSSDEEADHDEPVQTKEERQGKEQSSVKIVALDDLNADQIEVFAKARGATNTKSFLDAVERADAWSFTARPQDLEELAGFWNDQGRIGSRLEIMRNSIERRLAERDQDRADTRPLSAQRARQGTRLAAAVATMTREPAIRVPDGADNTKATAIQAILPDWDDKDQATLLSRPIFDEAIYGTVRFHHRSVREYLTAEWLAELLARETSRRKIEALLFRNQYGLDVVIPTMRPILPWLAILDEKVRERIRKVAPEVIFEGGDPSQLPLPTRKFILQEVCEQLASEASGRSAADYAAVQRFANLDLTDEVRNLLGKYAGNDELTGFLLRMVWLGRLEGALAEAKKVALNSSVSTYTRIAAFRAVKAVGSLKDQEELRSHLRDEGPVLRRKWLAELIEGMEATPDAVAWLIACLENAEVKPRFDVDRLTDAVAGFAELADLELLPLLVASLNRLLESPPVIERRYCEVSQRFIWLLKAAAIAVERLIVARHAKALKPEAFGILRKLSAARQYDGYETRDMKTDFAELVPAWPELNKGLFWFEVETTRQAVEKKDGKRLTDFWGASLFGPLWQFTATDFDDVLAEIGRRVQQDDKLVALSLAFTLYTRNERPPGWREKMKAAVWGNAELSEQLGKYLNPPAQSEEARAWKKQEASWKRRAAEREKKEQQRHSEWKQYLSENVELLRDPKLPKPSDISRAQAYLHEQVREKRSNSGRWTGGNWRTIAKDHGETVARAYRDGVVAYWRRYRPMIRSEGAPANSTPLQVILGLSGIEIEANETPGWPKGLNEEEVRLACWYASHELNGFPIWFPKLFDAFPKLVAEFLLQEIRYELSIEKPEEETHYILSDVSWSGEWTWDVLAPEISAYLGSNEPQNLVNLGKLLTILQGSRATDDEMKHLASAKVGVVEALRHAARWFAVWVGVDPDRAIPTLQFHIENVVAEESRTSFAMHFITDLLGGQRGGQTRTRQAFHSPQHLKSLYLLMHQYIRREDDIDRAGKGVYSPELRDDAQDSRNALFELLNRIPGKDAFLALEEISRFHPEESSRPWMLYHAKRKAEQDADMEPWSPAQILDFNQQLERTPTNHRDLADLAVMRLLDLKDDLENGDSSIAGILAKVPLETDMRKYVGRELREKAFGRYAIPQEEELADAKKPDLRFHGINFDGPVPIELKLADRWSGPDLFERLENQLCGDYLRDNRSTRGLFVLVYTGAKTAWDVPDGGNRVDFAGLIAALKNHWQQISLKFPAVENVNVIGIDLTIRLRRSSSAGQLADLGLIAPEEARGPPLKAEREGSSACRSRVAFVPTAE